MSYTTQNVMVHKAAVDETYSTQGRLLGEALEHLTPSSSIVMKLLNRFSNFLLFLQLLYNFSPVLVLNMNLTAYLFTV